MYEGESTTDRVVMVIDLMPRHITFLLQLWLLHPCSTLYPRPSIIPILRISSLCSRISNRSKQASSADNRGTTGFKGQETSEAVRMSVRKSPPPPGQGLALAKRARVDDEEDPSSQTLTVASSGEGQRKNALIRTIKRTSGLEAPIVSLSGAHGVSGIPNEGAFPDGRFHESLRL